MTEEELYELVDASADAVIVREAGGTIAFWNKGAEMLYGYSKDEALGRLTHELLHTEFITPLNEILNQVKSKGYWTGELGHTCKDGRKVYVLSRWSRRPRPSKLPDVLEVNTDITVRKAFERKVHEVNNVMMGNEREILRLRALLAENGISIS